MGPATRQVCLTIAGISAPLVVFLMLLEGLMHLLPVPSPLKTPAVNAENPVYRLLPDREFVNSLSWTLEGPVRRRVNNDGFVNDQDYDPADPRPLFAVIGDSYVEANYLPYDQTLNARLSAAAGDRHRVYSFGASGGPLSQYLVWADYARDRYRPSHMTFVIIGNDFDESLASHAVFPGFHHFVEAGDGALALSRFDFEPSWFRSLVRNSALARYLFYNVRLPARLQSLWAGLTGDEKAFVGNTDAAAEPHRIAASERAVRAFFDLLPEYSGLPAERIVFLVDGLRPELYDAEALSAAADSYVARMRTHFIAAAQERGYDVIDLQPRFIDTYQADDSERFEFSYDAHWNGRGHGLAADAVIGSAQFLDFSRLPVP